MLGLNFISGHLQSKQKKKTLGILKKILNNFHSAVFNGSISKICGKIRADLSLKGLIIGLYDLIIAATALHHNYILVTNNVKEFSRVDNLVIQDW